MTMPQYLLSTYRVAGQERGPMTPEQMQEAMRCAEAIEAEMRASGAFLFSGRLHDPDTSTVVRSAEGDVVTTDGPFVETKEFLAGFYILEADDLDSALGWASKAAAGLGIAIEVRPFVDASAR
jgi:hypothetical protein